MDEDGGEIKKEFAELRGFAWPAASKAALWGFCQRQKLKTKSLELDLEGQRETKKAIFRVRAEPEEKSEKAKGGEIMEKTIRRDDRPEDAKVKRKP